MTRAGRPAPSSCSAPPSSTAARRRSSPPGSTTPSTSTSRSMAPVLVVTGGKAEGDRTTEAATARAYAWPVACPAAAIAMEDEGRTTLESLQGVARLLRVRGIRDAVFVSDPTHMLRVLRMAGDLGIQSYGSPTRDEPGRERPGPEGRRDRPRARGAGVLPVLQGLHVGGCGAGDSLNAASAGGEPRPGPLPTGQWADLDQKTGRIPGHPPWRAGNRAPILCEILYLSRTPGPPPPRPPRSRPSCPPAERPPSVNRTEPPRATTTRRGTT